MVTTQPMPHVVEAHRVVVRPIAQAVFDVVAHYGFTEDPDVRESDG